MSRSANSKAAGSGLLTTVTALGLLCLPVLAAEPSTWPHLVGLSLLSSVGLVGLWRRDPLTTEQVLWGALVLRLAFLPLLPGLTDDLYRYIWDGWLQVEGINPYRYKPNADALSRFQSTILYDRLNSQPYYSVYPPLTQLVFWVGGWFYSVDWMVSYYVLKVMFTSAECAGLWLLSRLTSARNLLLYAWNPLVLLETAGQGHTEALLVLFVVGAVWAVRRDAAVLASLAVAGAGLVKLYPFILWPFLVRRYGWTSLWPGGLFVVGVTLPYAAPYVLPHIKASVDLFSQLFEFNAGPYYLAKYIFRLATGADWSKQIGPAFRQIFLVLLGLFYLLDWWRDWSFRRATLLAFGTFLFFGTTVHPWYFLPVLAVGILHERPAWPWFWGGAFSVGTYLFYVDGSYWVWIILGWGGGTLLGLWLYWELIERAWAALCRAGATGLQWARRTYERK
ncbi:MAG: hypothetical protein ABEL97_06760 [Salinibacter sp.]